MADPIVKRRVPLIDDIALLVQKHKGTPPIYPYDKSKSEPSSVFKVPDTRFDDEVSVLEGNIRAIR